MRALGLGVRAADGEAEAAKNLGLIVQTMRYLALHPTGMDGTIGEMQLTPWTLEEVRFSPRELFRNFLYAQHGTAQSALKVRGRKARWDYFEAETAALLMHPTAGYALSTALAHVRKALAATRADWHELWSELAAVPSAAVPLEFVTDREAATPAARRGRPL